MPASGCYFAAYEYTKQHFRKSNKELSFWHILVAGGFAGWANWAWALGPDVVKTRYQTGKCNKRYWSGLGYSPDNFNIKC